MVVLDGVCLTLHPDTDIGNSQTYEAETLLLCVTIVWQMLIRNKTPLCYELKFIDISSHRHNTLK